MIELHYNESVDVKRLADVEGTNKREFTQILSGVACQIQPLDPAFSQDIPGGFGKDFLMFCETVDIQEGDRIIRGSQEFRVTGVEKLDWQGQRHMEVSIRIFES